MRDWFGFVPIYLITIDASFCEKANDNEFCALLELIYAELSGDFPLGDSRQPTYKSLRPFDLVS